MLIKGLFVLILWTVISVEVRCYNKDVLMDLCQYIGVRYVRNPENPNCGYIACWDRHPYHMPCAPGLKVHTLFFWGDSYPCTERDTADDCNYFKNILKPGGTAFGYPVDRDTSVAKGYNNHQQEPQYNSFVVQPVEATQIQPSTAYGSSYSVNVQTETETPSMETDDSTVEKTSVENASLTTQIREESTEAV